jgi:hypothetical protein
MAWLVDERGRVLGTIDRHAPLLWRTEDHHGALIAAPLALWPGFGDFAHGLALLVDDELTVRKVVSLAPRTPRVLLAPAHVVALPRSLAHNLDLPVGTRLEVRE